MIPAPESMSRAPARTEMDIWRPGASGAALRARAKLLADLRAFFVTRDVLEVDTPLLCRAGVSDPAIEPLRVTDSEISASPLFLQTSPEFAMKRLLASGCGPIYQLGKVFRDGEVGRRHNPEFTMLEWYRPDFDLAAMMDEVGTLVAQVLSRPDWCCVSYQDIFRETLNLDPWDIEPGELQSAARERLELGDMELEGDAWLDLLMSHCIEAELKNRGLIFIYDYPATQAALARTVMRGARPVAERFELYVDGLELANGYRELLDAEELERRALQDNKQRQHHGQLARQLDPLLLAAMRSGLPDCSGVALGVDRLLMCLLGADSLSEVLPFDWSRC